MDSPQAGKAMGPPSRALTVAQMQPIYSPRWDRMMGSAPHGGSRASQPLDELPCSKAARNRSVDTMERL